MAITKVWLDEIENLPTTCEACASFLNEHDIPQAPNMTDASSGTVRYGTQFTTAADGGTLLPNRREEMQR